jgi:hypothetical protein
MLITLVYLCIAENIFHVFFIICLINVYIYLKMYLLIVLFIIWLIIKINMDECDVLNEVSLLCTNTLVFPWFCNCRFSIKKIGRCCLPNRVDIRMRIRIWDIRFVFVFENIWICIRIRVKMWQKVLSESDSMRIWSVSIPILAFVPPDMDMWSAFV